MKKEIIEKDCIAWSQKFIDPGFKFRPYQLETIVGIIDTVLSKKNPTQIIEAPTGSGKSLINIIAAGVLSEYYGKSSYILCSDVFLWGQYRDYIKDHPKIDRKFGILVGQRGNYKCNVNQEDIQKADCKMAGLSWNNMIKPKYAESRGYFCLKTCPYLVERKKAISSRVTLMTYSLYHYMINYVEDIFDRRDVIFCDECHNIPDIISGTLRPSIVGEQKELLLALLDFAKSRNTVKESDFGDNCDPSVMMGNFSYVRGLSELKLENEFYDSYYRLQDEDALPSEVSSDIDKYYDLLCKFSAVSELAKGYLSKKKLADKKISSRDRKLFDTVGSFDNLLGEWSVFLKIINDTSDGIEYVIKSVLRKKDPDKTVISFRCTKEDWLCWKFLLSTAGNCVMMSATIGGIEAFSQNVGVKYTSLGYSEFTRVPSTFNYSKSPIVFFNWWKMSYAYKDDSFPKLQPLVYQICKDKHPTDKGIIQTGSYANAVTLYQNSPKQLQDRMLMYSTSKEKEEAVEKHKNSTEPTILVGPTLAEGVDLPGDLCRFIIILKVPYPVIVDQYVKKKMERFPLWYRSATSNSIIQGIGRGVRYDSDYCETFILDACFYDLFQSTKSQYPKELQDRIIVYNR